MYLTILEALLFNTQLFLRQHCGHAFVLPASHWSMNSTTTRRSLLCSSAAGVDFLNQRDWRCRWIRLRRCRGYARILDALDDHWWRRRSSCPADCHAGEHDRYCRCQSVNPLLLREPRRASFTESAARPQAPSQTDDFLAALCAELWSIHKSALDKGGGSFVSKRGKAVRNLREFGEKC